MKDFNRFVLCRDNFKSDEEFAETIGKAVLMFCDNDYAVRVRYDDRGVGVMTLDYNCNNEEYGNPMPYFLTPDEFYQVKEREE